MSYELSRQCQLIAKRCALCGRPLDTLESMRLGVGPICRNKVVLDGCFKPLVIVKEADRLIFQVAMLQKGPLVDKALVRLQVLGFDRVSKCLKKRLDKFRPKVTDLVEISYNGGRLTVKTGSPVQGTFASLINAWRNIIGRKWDSVKKENTFPLTKPTKVEVFDILCDFFPGSIGLGPKGVFKIPG